MQKDTVTSKPYERRVLFVAFLAGGLLLLCDEPRSACCRDALGDLGRAGRPPHP